jgi:hypothetical protein
MGEAEKIAEAERAANFVRFFEYVDMDANSIGCWEWQAKRDTRGGYGYFSAGYKSIRAHRWIYQLVHGPIADDAVVRHKCDNPACVNPRHLELGTHADNKQDQIERGRLPNRQGEKHPMAKLNQEIVLDIRRRAAAGQPNPSIANGIGISTKLVGQIVRRETWKHI